MAASADPRQLSPKFTWPVLGGIVLFAFFSTLSTLSPEVLDGLGVYKGPLFSFLTLIGMGGLAYYKGDPLRQNYAAQVEAAQKSAETEIQAAAQGVVAEAEDGDGVIVGDYEEFKARHSADPQLYDGEVVGLPDTTPATPEVGK